MLRLFAGSWPEGSLEAFSKTKAAIGLQLADALAKSFNLTARPSEKHVVGAAALLLLLSAGLLHKATACCSSLVSTLGLQVTWCFVQDVFVDGFAFRLVLFSDREPPLYRKLLGENAWLQQPPHGNVALRTWHHGAMAMIDGLHPAFSLTARYLLMACFIPSFYPQLSIWLVSDYVPSSLLQWSVADIPSADSAERALS